MPQQTVDIVCICCLCNVFTWNLVCNAWSCAPVISVSVSTFTSPLYSYRNLPYSLISCLYSLHTVHAVVSALMFKDSRNLLSYVVCLPFWYQLISFVCFDYSTTFACILVVDLVCGWFISWLLTVFTNCLLYVLCSEILQYWLTLVCMSPQFETGIFLLLSFFTYSLFISAFGWWILYIVSVFLVSLSIFPISSILQFMVPKLCLSTGLTKAPIAIILFLAFNSDFSIILNLLVHSVFSLSFSYWCRVPTLSSFHGHL